MITTQTSLCNLTKLTNGPTISDFVILKAYKTDTHHQITPKLLRLFDSHQSIVGYSVPTKTIMERVWLFCFKPLQFVMLCFLRL